MMINYQDRESKLDQIKIETYAALKNNYSMGVIGVLSGSRVRSGPGVNTLFVVAPSIWMNEDPAITEKIVTSFSAWVRDLEETHAHEIDVISSLPETLHDISHDKCEISGFEEVKAFCEEFGIEKARDTYISIACRVFKGSEITLSLVADPEIEDDIKIKLNIKTKGNIEPLLKLDYDFFRALEVALPDQKERKFFVKTYEIIE